MTPTTEELAPEAQLSDAKQEMALPANELATERFPFIGMLRIPVKSDDGLSRFVRKLAHKPGTIVLGAPRNGGVYETRVPTNKRQARRAIRCKPTRYITFKDGSLRREDLLIQKRFAALPDEEKRELLSQVMAGVQKEAANVPG